MRAGIRGRPWAGLDIGSYSVKLVASQGGVGSPRYWLAEYVLPAISDDADPKARAHAIADAIGKCLAQANLSPRSFHGISLGISGPDVIVKQITLPLLSDEEVATALRFEARKHLPFDPQGMIIDYQIIGRFPSEKRLELLLAAVSEQHLGEHVAPLRALDMDADIVDAAPLALTNAVMYNMEQSAEAHLLLDIGHLSSHLALYHRGHPFFARRIGFGGMHLTKAISNRLQIPFAEAEEWKLAAGSDQPGFVVDWKSREMAAVLEVIENDLGEELRRSFAFYSTMGSLPDPARLWVSGGSARLPGLVAHMGQALGMSVMLFNPLEHFNGSPRGGSRPTLGPQFAQAFGLAMRTA